MSDNLPFMSKQDMLNRIHLDRQSFAAIWQSLTDEHMIKRPGPQADWSVKDLIAHIVWWENFMIWRINDKLSGGAGKREKSIEAYNIQIFEDNKDRDLSETLTEFEDNFSKVIEFVKTLSDEQINDPAVINISGESLLHYLAGDTFAHYDAHRDDLQSYVDSLPQP
ncbi:MAG: ClbS/DfsB family four-helix bundle protein [Phototrophicaceae bacterium]